VEAAGHRIPQDQDGWSSWLFSFYDADICKKKK
jgi:hypothetical protein